MDKGKSPALPPPSGPFSGFSSYVNAPNNFNQIPEMGQTSESNLFSQDVSKMPDNPHKILGHRRAHSKILTCPDDITFGGDIGAVGAANGTSYSDEAEEDLVSMYFDVDKFDSASLNSLFEDGDLSNAAALVAAGTESGFAGNASVSVGSSVKPSVGHQHSQSMDGSTSTMPDMLMSGSEGVSRPAGSRRAVAAAKLAELALVDPNRAKRILSNRQAAVRSKERKMRQIAELEQKAKTRQIEATSLSAQLNILERGTNGLTAEISQLKLYLQTMEQQVQLQDALNDALEEDIQHMKKLTTPNGGPMMNVSSFGDSQHYYPDNNAMNALLAAQQFEQLQIQSQKHQHLFAPHQQLQKQHQTGGDKS